MMLGVLLGVAIAVSATGASQGPEPPRATVTPVIFNFEIPETASRDLRERGPAWSTQGTRAKRSMVERVLAVTVGASVGFVVGARIGYAVTPKRGPYDDTSGLKGIMIGAPIGAATGALIGYWLTR